MEPSPDDDDDLKDENEKVIALLDAEWCGDVLYR